MTNCFSIIENFLFINTTNTYHTISCVVNMLNFLGKAIVIALSSKYCLRVTAEGTNQNVQLNFSKLKLY